MFEVKVNHSIERVFLCLIIGVILSHGWWPWKRSTYVSLQNHTLAVRLKVWESPMWGPCTLLGSLPSLKWPLVAAGMGDMAVSNSIGSNVFDILIGLGLPWALQTLAVDYGSYVSGFLQDFSWNPGLRGLCFNSLGHRVFVSGQRGCRNRNIEGKTNSPCQRPS